MTDMPIRILFNSAGELPDRNTTVVRYIVQSKNLFGDWIDAPAGQHDTQEEAEELATRLAGWEHVLDVRVVERTIAVSERVVAGERPAPPPPVSAAVAVTPETRHFTASAVVLDPATRRVLLIKHNLTGRWQFPGGHVDPNETAGEAALREVREETQVRAELWQIDRVPDTETMTWQPSPIMTGEHVAPADLEYGEPTHHHIDLLFLAVADSTTSVTYQADEVSGVRWVDMAELWKFGAREDVVPAVYLAWQALDRGERAPR